MPYKNKEDAKAWKKRNAKKISAYNRKHYEENIDKIKKYKKANSKSQRKYFLKSLYGIDIKEYNRLFEIQHGKCAICGKHQTEEKKALSVDHCHATGAVRGLLCGNCNRGIGMLGDDIENLKCAIIYLNKSAGIGHPE